ncbi:hypothetical protein MACJ_002503 [Theileria orientalis]|uniref:SfiI-subtelomeric related protein family member n=1 Tax=Theileria orientalis TaxID=68886 RepID=A0A976M8P8_THEOR|nr:hypothetical protein MACJ_002503 [Theileria orientalis]
MKINTISTYVLVCLLIFSKWNLIVLVRAAGEDGSVASSDEADGVVGSQTCGAPETSTDADASAGLTSELVVAGSNVEADPTNVTLDSKVPDKLPGLRPFKDDANGNSVEINEDDFYQDLYFGNITYVFKKDVKCTLVKYGGKDVWKKGEHGVDEPKSVTYDTKLREVTVRDANNSVHFKKDTGTGQWKHLKALPRKKVNRVFQTGYSSGSAETSPDANITSNDTSGESSGTSLRSGCDTHTGGESGDGSHVASPPAGEAYGQSGDGSAYGGGASPPANQGSGTRKSGSGAANGGGTASVESSGSSTSKTGVDLDITSESFTDQFEYKKDGQYVTYTAKGNNAFKLVKDGNTEVWETTDSTEYSPRVEVDLMNYDAKAVTVFVGDNKTKVFKKDFQTSKWEEIDLTILNLKFVNIYYEHETYFFTNTIDDKNVRTFEAKNGFCFNGSNEYIDDKKIEIWKTTNDSEYSTKIEVEGDKVTIHIGEGTTASTKVFKKGTYGKWAEDNSEPESSSSKTEDESTSCGWSCMWNKITGWLSSCGWCNSCGSSTSKTGVDLNLSSETKSGKKFEYNKVGQYVSYTPKDNYAFKLVKDDDTEVWEASDASNYSLRIEVDLINNDAKAVTVYLDENKTKVFKKDHESDPWNEINTTIVNPKSINIDYQYESYFYKNTLDNNLRTFIPKTGFAFNIVYRFIDENRVIIWKTNDEKEYSNKVVTEGNNKITIYIGDDGTAKVFNKGSDGTWAEDTYD